MNSVISLALAAVEALLPYIASASSGSVQAVVVLLEKIVPEIASYGPAVVTSVRNIIDGLQGSGVVTADQAAALDAQATAMEAALDAQAAKDGLSGVPAPSP